MTPRTLWLGGRRMLLWAVPLVALAANLGWYLAFGSGSRMQVAELERRLDRLREVEADLANRLESHAGLWSSALENRQAVERLYADQFSTERARFTDTVRELKDLAERAGLRPNTIGYPRESLERYGLTRKSFVFSVVGSYGSLRTLLHLLDLSPSFLVVEQIAVGNRGAALGVQLRLSTYFAEEESGGEAQPGGGS